MALLFLAFFFLVVALFGHQRVHHKAVAFLYFFIFLVEFLKVGLFVHELRGGVVQVVLAGHLGAELVAFGFLASLHGGLNKLLTSPALSSKSTSTSVPSSSTSLK